MKLCRCKKCNSLLNQDTAVRRDYIQDKHLEVAYFCSTDHMHSWYISHLQQVGM